MELWDLYTENRVKTGETHVRGNPLPKEKYHLVVNVWIKKLRRKVPNIKVLQNKTQKSFDV